jgi:Fe-S oxidoreductase
MARMKIEVLAQHRRRHGLTLRDKMVGNLPRYAARAAGLAPLLAMALRVPGVPWLVEHAVGFDRRRPLPAWQRPWLGSAGRQPEGAGLDVVLFADTFNNYFEPGNLAAAARVLLATGHRVLAPTGQDGRPLCCGRTYLAAGMVEEARAEARRTIAALQPFLERGTPVLGVEPSCLFTFQDEYEALLPNDAGARMLAEHARLADAHLAKRLREAGAGVPWKDAGGLELRVHGHCHQKAFGTFEATLELLRTVPGSRVSAIESSCCGMAGAFGHEKAHYDVSMTMAEADLLPAVRAAPEACVIAAGTSCRQQIAHGTGRSALHPLAWLAQQL